MQDAQYPEGPYTPVVPPTIPGALPQAVPISTWPTVLGVISIVLGILGVLGGVWGMVAMTVIARFMPPASAQVMDQMEGMEVWTMISSAVGLVVAVLLLVVGVGICTRRRWSVATAKVWAAVKILVVVLNIGMSWYLQDAAVQSNPAANNMNAGFMIVVQGISLVFGLVWGWALPVFMLIWFSRAKIKAEVSTWK